MTRPDSDGNEDGAGLRPYLIANRILLVALAGVTALLVSGRVTDEDRVEVPLIGTISAETCVYKRTHGIECSSCGITRSVVAAFDGNLTQSRDFHTAGLAVVAFLILQIVLRAVFSTKSFSGRWKWDAAITAASIVACFWEFIVRIPNPVS